jgi:hypothetical protein
MIVLCIGRQGNGPSLRAKNFDLRNSISLMCIIAVKRLIISVFVLKANGHGDMNTPPSQLLGMGESFDL